MDSAWQGSEYRVDLPEKTVSEKSTNDKTSNNPSLFIG